MSPNLARFYAAISVNGFEGGCCYQHGASHQPSPSSWWTWTRGYNGLYHYCLVDKDGGSLWRVLCYHV